MRILFLGTADFGISALKRLVDEKFSIAGIVTALPKPKGRGLKTESSPIADFASRNNLAPVFTPDNLKNVNLVKELNACNADLFVVIAYRLLPREIFQIPKLGTINVHASLLPKFRGAAPIQRAIEAGEKKTGVSVFQINTGVDTGRIISQKSLSIGDHETTPQLYERLSSLGAETLIEVCRDFRDGAVASFEQVHDAATPAPKLTKGESWIDWDLPAGVIFNKIRAFKPFPGTCTRLNGKQLGIEWAVPVENRSEIECGTVGPVTSEWFEVQCGAGSLRILEVKPAGKKEMTVRDYLNGTKIETGMKTE